MKYDFDTIIPRRGCCIVNIRHFITIASPQREKQYKQD